MSLYREPGRRRPWTLAAAALAVVASFALGLLVGRATAEPSLGEALDQVQEETQGALAALEIVPIEYGEAVRDGEVVAETEYEAAQAAVARAREVLSGVRGELAVLDGRMTRAAEDSLADVAELVDRRAPPDEVAEAAEEAERALRIAAGLAPEAEPAETPP